MKETLAVTSLQQARFLKELRDLLGGIVAVGTSLDTVVQAQSVEIKTVMEQIAASLDSIDNTLSEISGSLATLTTCVCDPDFGD